MGSDSIGSPDSVLLNHSYFPCQYGKPPKISSNFIEKVLFSIILVQENSKEFRRIFGLRGAAERQISTGKEVQPG